MAKTTTMDNMVDLDERIDARMDDLDERTEMNDRQAKQATG